MSTALPQYSLADLAQFDGETKDRVYISIAGNVFDVTDSGFYNKSGRYHVFAGKDLTVCLIKSSLEPSMTNNMDVAGQGITETQLQGKVDFYKNKYKRVGSVKEWVEVNGDKLIYSEESN